MNTFLFSESTAPAASRPLGRRILEISDESRRALARHFQDQVAPSLTASLIRARDIAIQLYMDNHPAHEEADALVRALEDAQTYADQLIRQQLGPVIAQDLIPTLTDLAQRTHCTFRLHCHFQQVGPAPELDAEETLNIYRFASELLALSRRRDASTILLRLENTPDSLSLTVIDDGTPLRKSADENLLALAFRASMSQTRFETSRSDDGKTHITCHFQSA